MKQISLPSYTEFNQALSKTAVNLHPSQVHGLLCGLLCGNPESEPAWEEVIADLKDSSKSKRTLQDLYEKSAKLLADFSFEFQLLLPSDSQSLRIRAEALTLWCQGFLTGLKLTQVPIENRPKSEVTESINDLVEIAKMNFEDVVASEEDEAAYIELVEYVRMAVVMIYQDLREGETPKATGAEQHH